MTRQSLRVRAKRFGDTSGTLDRREAAVSAMNAPLRRKFLQISGTINRLQEDNLRFYYQLGRTLQEVQENPDVYGKNAFKLICDAMSTSIGMLRISVRFATAYNPEELEELVNLRNASADFRLHMKHVSYLLIVPNKDERREFAQRAVEGLWEPQYLHAKIKEKYGATRPGSGRRHTLPDSVSAQIRQIVAVSDTWLKKYQQAWNGEQVNAFANIINSPPDRYTEEDLTQMRRALQLMQQISDAAGEAVQRCEQIISHMEHCLAAQAAQRREEAAAAATEQAAQEVQEPPEAPTRTRSRPTSRVVQLPDAARVARRAMAAAGA